MKKNLIFLILMSLLLVEPVFCQLYMWTDENGVKHFSNVAPVSIEENIKSTSEIVSDESDQHNKTNDKKLQMEKALKKRETLKKQYEDKKKARLEGIKKRRKELEAARGNLKEHWEALYGPITGTFEGGKILQTINFEGNLFSLTDGSNWGVVGDFPRLRTAAWTAGNRMSINRKDGIIINKSRGADVWVKIRPR